MNVKVCRSEHCYHLVENKGKYSCWLYPDHNINDLKNDCCFKAVVYNNMNGEEK